MTEQIWLYKQCHSKRIPSFKQIFGRFLKYSRYLRQLAQYICYPQCAFSSFHICPQLQMSHSNESAIGCRVRRRHLHAPWPAYVSPSGGSAAVSPARQPPAQLLSAVISRPPACRFLWHFHFLHLPCVTSQWVNTKMGLFYFQPKVPQLACAWPCYCRQSIICRLFRWYDGCVGQTPACGSAKGVPLWKSEREKEKNETWPDAQWASCLMASIVIYSRSEFSSGQERWRRVTAGMEGPEIRAVDVLRPIHLRRVTSICALPPLVPSGHNDKQKLLRMSFWWLTDWSSLLSLWGSTESVNHTGTGSGSGSTWSVAWSYSYYPDQ